MKLADVLNEKSKGLWHNIHAKRKRGEKPAKPGDKDYPKSLDVGEAEYQGRKVKLNKPTRGDTKKSKVYVNSGKKNKDGSAMKDKDGNIIYKVIFNGNAESLGVKQNVVDIKPSGQEKDSLDDILS